MSIKSKNPSIDEEEIKRSLEYLDKKEKESGLDYEDPIKLNKEKELPLGKAISFTEESPVITGMDSPWKKIPLSNLPSQGFGYPPETELTIKPVLVSGIKHFSTIDENDPISIDEKINHIISTSSTFKWRDGILSYKDIYQEDRFYIFMVIRDITFAKGENRIFIPTSNKCNDESCPIPASVELNSGILSNFKLDNRIKKYYDVDNGFFNLQPKNGDPAIQLFIPTIGVFQEVRKILDQKKKNNKQYDESFSRIATFIIPNWRGLDETVYDGYEKNYKSFTYSQFILADGISKEITFATKNSLSITCSKCGAEVTAPIRFQGGIRSLYIISDIFGQLL